MTDTEPPAGIQGPLRPRRAEDFDAYYESTPPWDIGRTQPAFQALADAGHITGRVIDVGCGTGEHALLAAALGLEVTGVDLAKRALESARAKAADRGLSVDFRLADALDLAALGGGFDTALDCGLFHIFEDADRPAYVRGLGAAVRPGGRYHMLCFSEHQPGDWGPRRVTRDEIRANFSDGWTVDSIDPATIDITIDPAGARAWLASLTRTSG